MPTWVNLVMQQTIAIQRVAVLEEIEARLAELEAKGQAVSPPN